ncbi:VanW family protein [Sporanaerobacter acetigenes]|uniref:VanW family protein n=1 Tax=Sporanaerobacter acetigenes TaxID=165813 RepID=UPI0033191AD3
MKKEKQNNKKRNLILFYIIVVLALLSIGSYGISTVLNRDTIYEGIKIGKFDVGNMTKAQALNKIKGELEEDLAGKQMTLKYEDKNYNVKIADLGFHYNYEKAVNEAYSIGREGNIINKLKTIIDTKKYGKTLGLETSYDKNLINDLAHEISRDINLESKEAVFNFNGGKMHVTDEIVGRKTDTELLKQLIDENVYKLEDVDIPVEKIQPKATKAQLSRINGVIGQFSTSFKTSSSDRKENIRVAAKSIDGKLLMPGDTVSFNEITGPRSKQNGYREANVILEGEFTPGLGGGVCQVSTTLYNALLNADVKVVERHPHSIPAKYVSYGQDAAVSFGGLDLKFRNDFDFPIYIHTKVSSDNIYIYVYGDVNTKNYNVKINSELVEKVEPVVETILDNSLKPGEKVLQQVGRTGYKTKTYKSIIKNGKVVKKELLHSDYYKSRKYIYKIGPKIEEKIETSTEEAEE